MEVLSVTWGCYYLNKITKYCNLSTLSLALIMVIKLKIPINLFPNKKTLFNKSWKSTCQSGIWCDVLFKPFYNFWHNRISSTFKSKKKTDRTRGAIEVDNVAQSDLSTKILVLHLSFNTMGPKNLSNCIQIP